jgi:hypothetical protein
MPLFESEPFKLGLQQGFANTATKSVSGTTETSLIPTGMGSKDVPAGWFKPGNNVRIIVRGLINTQLTPGTLTVRVKLGSTTIIQGSTSALLASASQGQFRIALNVLCFTPGNPGSLAVSGDMTYPNGLVIKGSIDLVGKGIAINTTVAQPIDVTVQLTNGLNSLETLTSTFEFMQQ